MSEANSELSTSSADVAEMAEWCQRVPNCTTFRANTLCYSVEECISQLGEQFTKKFSYGFEKLPDIYAHDLIPECVVIGKISDDMLDLSLKKEEVIVDAGCGAAVLRGSNVYAPGVMGMLPSTKVNSQVSLFADLTASCLKGYKRVFDSDGKLFLGNGVAIRSRRELFNDASPKLGVAVELRHPVSGLIMPDLHSSLGVLQNFPSMVCVRVLDPKPGEIVLDMCAAPGNKTTHIGTLMNDEGLVIGIDRKSKVHLVAANCAVVNLKKCVRIFAADSTKIVADVKRQIEAGPPFAVDTFDKILLDAPCSGTGLRPMLSNRITSEARTRSFSHLQKLFVDNAVRLLKPGGTLVYSTCSVLCEENECLVAWTLDKYPEVKLVSATPVIGGAGLPGCGLNEEQRMLVQRFGMNETRSNSAVQSIGFFIAKFVKNV
ncbi:hypothetical protein V9T40_009871 [Parthenolecanium corni]|uniref:SAM-dependent MTase RsmB/NOP-type domain-containing protein n=1 Tax=Parthenolecanium corni TaxID=536013 RepID=A0AAN9TMM5_9HEMI